MTRKILPKYIKVILRKALAAFVAGVFLFNDIAYASEFQNLATWKTTGTREFEESFSGKYGQDALSHIRDQIDSLGGFDKLTTRMQSGIIVALVPGSHGACLDCERFNGNPAVVYVDDKKLLYADSVVRNAKAELTKRAAALAKPAGAPNGSIPEGLKCVIINFIDEPSFTVEKFRKARGINPKTKDYYSETTIRSELNGLAALHILKKDYYGYALSHELAGVPHEQRLKVLNWISDVLDALEKVKRLPKRPTENILAKIYGEYIGPILDELKPSAAETVILSKKKIEANLLGLLVKQTEGRLAEAIHRVDSINAGGNDFYLNGCLDRAGEALASLNEAADLVSEYNKTLKDDLLEILHPKLVSAYRKLKYLSGVVDYVNENQEKIGGASAYELRRLAYAVFGSDQSDGIIGIIKNILHEYIIKAVRPDQYEALRILSEIRESARREYRIKGVTKWLDSHLSPISGAYVSGLYEKLLTELIPIESKAGVLSTPTSIDAKYVLMLADSADLNEALLAQGAFTKNEIRTLIIQLSRIFSRWDREGATNLLSAYQRHGYFAKAYIDGVISFLEWLQNLDICGENVAYLEHYCRDISERIDEAVMSDAGTDVLKEQLDELGKRINKLIKSMRGLTMEGLIFASAHELDSENSQIELFYRSIDGMLNESTQMSMMLKAERAIKRMRRSLDRDDSSFGAGPGGSLAQAIVTIDINKKLKKGAFTKEEFKAQRINPKTGKPFSDRTVYSELNGLVGCGILRIAEEDARPRGFELTDEYKHAPPYAKEEVTAYLRTLSARPAVPTLEKSKADIQKLLSPYEKPAQVFKTVASLLMGRSKGSKYISEAEVMEELRGKVDRGIVRKMLKVLVDVRLLEKNYIGINKEKVFKFTDIGDSYSRRKTNIAAYLRRIADNSRATLELFAWPAGKTNNFSSLGLRWKMRELLSDGDIASALVLARNAVKFLDYRGPHEEQINLAARAFFESVPDAYLFKHLSDKDKSRLLNRKGILPNITYYIENIVKYPMLTELGEITLSARANLGDLEAKKLIWESNLRLVIKPAKFMWLKHPRLSLIDDIVSPGNFGLERAADKFEPQRGGKFSTYALWWVRQMITRSILYGDSSSIVKVPPVRREKRGKFFDACYRIGKDPADGRYSSEELAADTGFTLEEVIDLRYRQYKTFSLDRESGTGETEAEDKPLKDIIGGLDPELVRIGDEEARAKTIEKMEAALKLGSQARKVWDLKTRPNLEGRSPGDPWMDLKDAGSVMGLTKERIRQIEAKFTPLLKKMLENERNISARSQSRKRPPPGSIKNALLFAIFGYSAGGLCYALTGNVVASVGVTGVLFSIGAFLSSDLAERLLWQKHAPQKKEDRSVEKREKKPQARSPVEKNNKQNAALLARLDEKRRLKEEKQRRREENYRNLMAKKARQAEGERRKQLELISADRKRLQGLESRLAAAKEAFDRKQQAEEARKNEELRRHSAAIIAEAAEILTVAKDPSDCEDVRRYLDEEFAKIGGMPEEMAGQRHELEEAIRQRIDQFAMPPEEREARNIMHDPRFEKFIEGNRPIREFLESLIMKKGFSHEKLARIASFTKNARGNLPGAVEFYRRVNALAVAQDKADTQRPHNNISRNKFSTGYGSDENTNRSDELPGISSKHKPFHSMYFKLRGGDSLVSQNGLKIKITEINKDIGFVSFETSWTKGNKPLVRNLSLHHSTAIGYGINAHVDKIISSNSAAIVIKAAPSVTFRNHREEKEEQLNDPESAAANAPQSAKQLPPEGPFPLRTFGPKNIHNYPDKDLEEFDYSKIPDAAADTKASSTGGRPAIISKRFSQFGKERLSGLNISQAAKLIDVTHGGLSLHLKKHPEDFDTYGILKPVNISTLLQSFGKERLNDLNTTQAAKLIGVSRDSLSPHLKKHPKDFDTYGILKPVNISALLQSFGREKLGGLNVTQTAKLIGVSEPGLSYHLKKHPEDRDAYGIFYRKEKKSTQDDEEMNSESGRSSAAGAPRSAIDAETAPGTLPTHPLAETQARDNSGIKRDSPGAKFMTPPSGAGFWLGVSEKDRRIVEMIYAAIRRLSKNFTSDVEVRTLLKDLTDIKDIDVLIHRLKSPLFRRLLARYRYKLTWFGADRESFSIEDIYSDKEKLPNLMQPVTIAPPTKKKGKPIPPCDFLEALKYNEKLLEDARSAHGIKVIDIAKSKVGEDERQVGKAAYKIYESLLAAGIFAPVAGSKNIRLADMMIGPHSEYTNDMINLVNDVKWYITRRVGQAGPREKVILKSHISDKDAPRAKEYIKMAVLHQINSQMPSVAPEGKVLWHLIENKIIPRAQKDTLITPLNKASRDSNADERVHILSEDMTIAEEMAIILDKCPNAVFDIALSDESHIEAVQAIQSETPIKMLVFKGEAGDFVQVEGIEAALRALHLSDRAEVINKLLRIYSTINGTAYNKNVPPLSALDDPAEFARAFIFDLPAAKQISADEIPRMNDRLIAFITSA